MIRRSLFLSLALAFQVGAAEVAFIKIPGVFDYKTPQAPYNRLLTELRTTMTIDGRYLPSARANKLMLTGKLDCIFPILPPKRQDSAATIISEPINGLKAYAFTLAGKERITSLSQMRGKPVAYLRGYVYGGFIEQNPDIHFFPVIDHVAAIGVLQKGRADAYLDYIPDIRLALSEEGYNLLDYDIEKPIITGYDRIECIDNPDNRVFLDKINERINELKRSGKMQKLLGKYYVSTD